VQGRFRHLFRPENEHLIQELQEEVDRRWQRLLWLAGESK
jgi:pyruvate ferredoxin oxidoreductase beta subunit